MLSSEATERYFRYINILVVFKFLLQVEVDYDIISSIDDDITNFWKG